MKQDSEKQTQYLILCGLIAQLSQLYPKYKILTFLNYISKKALYSWITRKQKTFLLLGSCI